MTLRTAGIASSSCRWASGWPAISCSFHILPLLLLAAGAVGRVGWRRLGVVPALFALVSLQVALPLLCSSVPHAAALHPAATAPRS